MIQHPQQRRHRRTRVLPLFALIAAGLNACGSDAHTFTFIVTDSTGAPVRDAHVRAAPVGVSPVPLPVSPESLHEAGFAPGPGGYTDQAGRLTLTLERDATYIIRLDPSAFDLPIDSPTSQYRLAPSESALEPYSPGESAGIQPLRLEIVR